jgi:hypothetical protein
MGGRLAAESCGSSVSAGDPVAACPFGSIQRGVRFLDPVGRGLLVRQLDDADADRHVRAGDQAGILHETAEILGDRQRVGESCSRQQQDELLAARAEQRINLADPLSHQRHERLQDAISFRVPERVVEVLEAIDIEHQQRRMFTRAAAPLDRGCERGVHLTAIERAGQRIGDRLLLEGADTPLEHGSSDSGECGNGQEDDISCHGSLAQKVRASRA